MNKKNDFYEKYTSTSSLANVDEVAVLEWSKGFFRAHYSKLLPQDKNAKIVELGCGYGRYIKTLLEMGYTNCYGVDISEEQISYAKNKLGLVNVEQAEAINWLEDKQEKYDCILALDILEHLEIDVLLSMGEKIALALKPGGKLIIQAPNGMSPLNPNRYGDLTHLRAFVAQSAQQLFLNIGLIPSGYFEVAPHIYNVKSGVQRLIWTSLIKPCLSIFVLLMHGRIFGGPIFTSNLIAVATKKNNHLPNN
jgi:2-polyprenyl-3-methyl-5-hydroxy-6-metoxy-1,4-benzoquinol methylase